MQKSEINYDILIIGSGPIGATYARVLSDAKPNAKILMVDLGPQLTDKIGQHTKNVEDPAAMEIAQIKSQGPKQTPYPPISVAQRAMAVQRGELSAEILARAGTHLANDQEADLLKSQMPAAAMSSNVGGMGVHWTCACPYPGNEERISFIPELDAYLAKAQKILHVTQNAFPPSPEGQTIIETLSSIFGDKLAPDRQVQAMPLACKVGENGERYWTGSDLILGNTINNPNFEIRSETICRKLILNSELGVGNVIQAAEIEHLTSGKKEIIEAKIVIVAADALRTPQLLWASGIRPKALGHYLNEHPFIFTFVSPTPSPSPIGRGEKKAPRSGAGGADPLIGVFWVPFDAPHHRFHGQIMHMDLSPMKTTSPTPDPSPIGRGENEAPPSGAGGASKHIVGLGWGCLKEVQFQDCIEFSETETDYLGMPKMNFKFAYTDKDKEAIEQAKTMQTKAAEAFGKVIKDGDQTLMPAGTSMHYEGTTRMGETNDGTSVCDSYSQVWGYDNLFVGGNGVIPTSTTSNPTLTSVALAVRACEKIIKLL